MIPMHYYRSSNVNDLFNLISSFNHTIAPKTNLFDLVALMLKLNTLACSQSSTLDFAMFFQFRAIAQYIICIHTLYIPNASQPSSLLLHEFSFFVFYFPTFWLHRLHIEFQKFCSMFSPMLCTLTRAHTISHPPKHFSPSVSPHPSFSHRKFEKLQTRINKNFML